MKIIIPMSGIGKRFTGVGYSVPKFLINLHGKPIIEYVVSMFPKEHEIIFICNEEHLKSTNLRETLKRIKPEGKIISIPSQTHGPVYATTYVLDVIRDDEEVLVSYCDFFMDWDFKKMIEEVKKGKYDGAVPSYTGFHPHLLHKKLYGGILADKNNTMIDYKEKHSFTKNPQDSYHSVGAYYFRLGSDFKKYTKELLNMPEHHIGGEAYTSMLYYLYLRDKKKVYVTEVTKFMQWGTPEDLEEYVAWARYIKEKDNIDIQESDIPKNRNTSIPWSEDTEEFKASYTYWAGYFKK